MEIIDNMNAVSFPKKIYDAFSIDVLWTLVLAPFLALPDIVSLEIAFLSSSAFRKQYMSERYASTHLKDLHYCPVFANLSFPPCRITNITSTHHISWLTTRNIASSKYCFTRPDYGQILNLVALSRRNPQVKVSSLDIGYTSANALANISCTNSARTGVHIQTPVQFGLLTDSMLMDLAELCQNLEYFNISGRKNVTAVGCSALFEKCLQLQELSMNFCPVFAAPPVPTSSVIFFPPTLMKLSLQHCYLHDDHLEIIARQCGELVSVNVSSNTSITGRGICAIVNNCYKLEELVLARTNLIDSDFGCFLQDSIDYSMSPLSRFTKLDITSAGEFSGALIRRLRARVPILITSPSPFVISSS